MVILFLTLLTYNSQAQGTAPVCPTIGSLTGVEDLCQNETLTVFVGDFENMAGAENNVQDFGIELLTLELLHLLI